METQGEQTVRKPQRGSQRGESLRRGHTHTGPRVHACNRARTRWQFQEAVERGRWCADSQADGCPGSQTETRSKIQGDLSGGRGPAIPQTCRTGFMNG